MFNKEIIFENSYKHKGKQDSHYSSIGKVVLFGVLTKSVSL